MIEEREVKEQVKMSSELFEQAHKSNTEAPRGFGILGRMPIYFREPGRTANYFRGTGEQAITFRDLGSSAKK